jgi:hypothetical protein
MEARMNRFPKWLDVLPIALLALLATPATAIDRPGPALERNEARTLIEKRFLEKQKICDSFQGAERERCLADAKAARDGERAAVEAGHAGVKAKREAREASGTDPRASLQRAGEEELAVQRRIAMARCDEEPRDKREACHDVARARYGR